ncbi:T-complex protein 1 subunit eta [Heterocephalus glaber]|uniref:T-complex protein 1 subunit eta n=1 Tax=Heterocephalus glaber TaxID=10181 RepID=G5BP06_HETGA|nr:T-complex protein 1 subunit eta [Heterocephalus glaber]
MMPTPVILLKEGTDSSEAIPQLQTLVDIAKSQDAKVGDDTSSVTLLAAEFLKEKQDKVEQRKLLEKCAMTALSSKLISHQETFFAKMVVDAMMMLDDLQQLKMIGIKTVQGGALEESQLVAGVAFKKTFSCAGFEMQPKMCNSPTITLLNVELELKAEKDNAKIRIHTVEDYQAIVDAEWNILYDKLEKIYNS